MITKTWTLWMVYKDHCGYRTVKSKVQYEAILPIYKRVSPRQKDVLNFHSSLFCPEQWIQLSKLSPFPRAVPYSTNENFAFILFVSLSTSPCVHIKGPFQHYFDASPQKYEKRQQKRKSLTQKSLVLCILYKVQQLFQIICLFFSHFNSLMRYTGEIVTVAFKRDA